MALHSLNSDRRDRRGSPWSALAIGSAVLVWVGGIGLHLLSLLAPLVAVVGVVAGLVASSREPRRGWRVAAFVAGLVCLAGLAVYVLVLTSAIDWPPSRW